MHNIVMHTTHMQKNIEIKRHIHFDRRKANLFLRDLERDLGSMTYNRDIVQIYYNLILPFLIPYASSLMSVRLSRIIELPMHGMTKTVKLSGK